jgi:hypothetical protein
MKKGWIGGWKTKTWLHFEDKVDFLSLIWLMKNYEVKNRFDIYFLWKKVAEAYKKHDLYKYFLEPRWIDYKKIISAKLLPDNAIYVLINNTMFIVEIKYQEIWWSVDEKLQTCDYKKNQYSRLVSSLWIKLEFCYVLNNWFKQDRYNDTLNYIQAMWCKYFFDDLPLDYLGLPISE